MPVLTHLPKRNWNLPFTNMLLEQILCYAAFKTNRGIWKIVSKILKEKHILNGKSSVNFSGGSQDHAAQIENPYSLHILCAGSRDNQPFVDLCLLLLLPSSIPMPCSFFAPWRKMKTQRLCATHKTLHYHYLLSGLLRTNLTLDILIHD